MKYFKSKSKNNGGLGYTVPNANSAEIQLHIVAAQNGSTTPEKTAKEAIAVIEAKQAVNPTGGTNTLEDAKKLLETQSAKQISNSYTAIDKIQIAADAKQKLAANQKRFELLVSQLQQMMIDYGFDTVPNRGIINKIQNAYNKAYSNNMGRLPSEPTYNENYKLMNGYIAEIEAKIAEIFGIIRTEKIQKIVASTGNENTAISPAIDATGSTGSTDYAFDYDRQLQTKFVDQDGVENVGAPYAPQGETESKSNMMPLLLGGAALLLLMKGI